MNTDTRPLAERVTQGPMHAFRLSDYLIIGEAPPAAGAHIARMTTRPDMGANAELITEAFNVTHETGLTPRELTRDREDLIVALKNILNAPGAGYAPMSDPESFESQCQNAQALLDRLTKP